MMLLKIAAPRAATGVAAVVGAVVVNSGPGPAVSSEEIFSDVRSVHTYGIELVEQLEIDEGCGDARFCQDNPISRAEMAAWLYRATARLNGDYTYHPPQFEGPVFSDALDGTWYLPYARWAAASGVITAEGGAFNPDGTVTRAEAAVMLTATFEHLAAPDRVWGIFADTDSLSETIVGAIEGIHAAGLTKGCATGPLRYCPDNTITRGQTATMLTRAIQRAKPTVGLIVNEPQAAQGYTIINTTRSDEVHLVDHLGRKVHTWRVEGHRIIQAELLENGNLLIRFHKPGNTGLSELSRDGDIIWEYTEGIIHHDFFKLPNGNVLLLLNEVMTSQEAVDVGARLNPASGRGLRYDYIREVKPTGPGGSEIVWEWSVLDHLVQDHAPDKPDYGPIANHPERIDINYTLHQRPTGGDSAHDWTHFNTIDYNPALGQIMLSVRNYSEIWIIDHSTTTEEAAGRKGDLLYRWGNPRAYGTGDFQDQQLFQQHDTHWIPPGLPGAGNVLIFNNGSEYTGLRRYYSSIDEIALPSLEDNAYPRDTDDFAFESPVFQWNYTAPNPTDFYAAVESGAQRLPNGNTQISHHNGTIFQITPNGEIVWKYINPVSYKGDLPAFQGDYAQYNGVYRAPWYPPDYPGLHGMDLTPRGPIEHYR